MRKKLQSAWRSQSLYRDLVQGCPNVSQHKLETQHPAERYIICCKTFCPKCEVFRVMNDLED